MSAAVCSITGTSRCTQSYPHCQPGRRAPVLSDPSSTCRTELQSRLSQHLPPREDAAAAAMSRGAGCEVRPLTGLEHDQVGKREGDPAQAVRLLFRDPVPRLRRAVRARPLLGRVEAPGGRTSHRAEQPWSGCGRCGREPWSASWSGPWSPRPWRLGGRSLRRPGSSRTVSGPGRQRGCRGLAGFRCPASAGYRVVAPGGGFIACCHSLSGIFERSSRAPSRVGRGHAAL